MALWDKLKTELDRAGRAAQTAIDDGKLRLDVMRVRQLADKTAETLGYAVFRARQGGQELDADSYARLSSTLAAHEAEVARLEAQLARATDSDRKEGAAAANDVTGAPEAEAAPSPASTVAPPVTSIDPAMGDDADRNATSGF